MINYSMVLSIIGTDFKFRIHFQKMHLPQINLVLVKTIGSNRFEFELVNDFIDL